MLARADLQIAAHYDQLAEGLGRRFRPMIEAEFALTRQLVLEIRESDVLLADNGTLQRAIALRNPHVDPMNLMQVDLLTRWRASQRQDRALFEALLSSVSGIARGLQTTG